MGKGSYESWLAAEKLAQLREWAGMDMSDRQIAAAMGVPPSTLAVWKRRYPALREALDAGRRADIVEEGAAMDAALSEAVEQRVEDALLKRALGYSYMETTYERDVDEDGREKMVVKRQTKKQVLPDLSAQMFWLKNRSPERWKDKQDTKCQFEDITVVLVDDEDED